ncbi:MAG: GldG family protein [Spirochaetaceae bacterium]|jgi:gliding-associated putative ABC transporter substrate-binding component GldG|nr:GldG family protein [Spirochaetaceae bacterium]
MTKRQATILAVLSVSALILALLLSGRIWFRLDLTKTRAHTISRVSRNLRDEIPDEVRITYYVSDKLASIHPIPGEIEDLLREYAAHSRGRIRFIRRDPLKANLTESVEQLGLLPQQIQTVERDEASIATVYTGILIEYLDKTEVIPVVFALDTLEYDLTSRIRALVGGRERELGVIVADGGKQWSENYGYLNQALVQSGFSVRLISPGEELADTLPALFVLGGAEGLDEWALYRIDRYIQGGGRVLFALDGVAVETQYGLSARAMASEGLLAMVASYGAAVKPELVLDSTALTLPFQSSGPGGSLQIRLIRYPHWIGVLESNGNPGHPISAGFAGVDVFWTSPVEINPPPGVEGSPLFSSTPDAWLQTGDFQINPDTPYLFTREEPDTRGVKVLAAALSGKFPSWFAGKPKPEREGSDEELPDLPRETKEGRIVVVGDSDMASAYIQYTRSQRNLDFLLQAADWLGNDDDIIGIRNRMVRTGRLDRIVDPERRAAQMAFARILNVVVIPLALIVVGLLLAARRRRLTGPAGAANPGGRANTAARANTKEGNTDGL